MRTAASILAGMAILGAASAAAQDQPISYPPFDQPLYLECKMKAVSETSAPTEWPGLVLYFPEGIESGFPEMQIVDAHEQLDGGRFGFSIKSENHWSLIDSDGVPDAEKMGDLPQIMFQPPQGPENLSMTYLKDGAPVRNGVCFGMIGPNTAEAYETALRDPSSLD